MAVSKLDRKSGQVKVVNGSPHLIGLEGMITHIILGDEAKYHRKLLKGKRKENVYRVYLRSPKKSYIMIDSELETLVL